MHETRDRLSGRRRSSPMFHSRGLRRPTCEAVPLAVGSSLAWRTFDSPRNGKERRFRHDTKNANERPQLGHVELKLVLHEPIVARHDEIPRANDVIFERDAGASII